ncbi:nucleotidyltransferase domain-containing protein [Rhizobium sp. 22-785-1]
MSIVDFLLSERKQRMLSALLLHPDRQYGSNELIAIGGPGQGAGKRILDQFENSGVVTKTARGNQRLYSANRQNPIYSELRSICLKTFGLASVIAKELSKYHEYISQAFVFGSIAQGTDKPQSDVDLMLVGSVDVLDLGEVLERLEKALGRRIDLNLYTDEEWNTAQGDRVVRSIMASPQITILEGTG